ncbi:MAG: methionine adenosyltransferase [Culicoidibacterales bacterium]
MNQNRNKILFTSESVSEGHPDKICDQISDSILDAYLALDPKASVACEVLITTQKVIIAGEINSAVVIDPIIIARNKLAEIGYLSEEIGINANTCEVWNFLHQQSPDIALGVEKEDQTIGAGDQGIMFGYAETGNENYMPLPIIVAHELVRRASHLRKSGAFPWARPDMKSQVTIDYTNEQEPTVDTIVLSIQHEENYDHDAFINYIETEIITPVLAQFSVQKAKEYKQHINPTGRFVIGGPDGDTGLTGRKIIVDTYGGYARHGGGAFSGKDATKVDRSAAYMARYLAKNIVASGFAAKCELQLSYAIGVVEPVSIYIDTFGTGNISNEEIKEKISKHINLTPAGIIEHLQLRKPIFAQTATYGHFGRTDVDLTWEHLDLVGKW